jgi:hypothetical protein
LKKVIQIVIACLVLTSACAFADTIDNSASGNYFNNGSHGGNGGSYYTGNISGSYANNFFVFDLATISGTVTAATFDVNSYSESLPSAVVYHIYETAFGASINNDCSSGCGAEYAGLVSGVEIGSISVGPSDSNTTLAIHLNSDGLAWLTANEGNVVVIGGNIGTQPKIQGAGPGIFSGSDFKATNSLDITTVATATPEPGTVAMLVFGLGAMVFSRRRRFSER